MPDDALVLGARFYDGQARRNRVAASAVQRAWRRADSSDLSGWFEENYLDVTLPVLQGMERSAGAAQSYMVAQTAAQGIDAPSGQVDPLGFTPGLDETAAMTYSASVIPMKEAIAEGAGLRAATALANRSLVRLASTLVADAGREATQASMATTRFGGWVRMLRPPSCKRCAVQAGKWFRWNEGFERHPNCDCIHIPSAEAIAGDRSLDVTAAIRSGQVTGLSKADTLAILEDGADPSQVINASRGMSTSNVFGQRLQTTTEGVTRRGVAYRSMGQAQYVRRQGEMKAAGQRYRSWRSARLTPSAIYGIAENRADAVRLLRLYGYILPE